MDGQILLIVLCVLSVVGMVEGVHHHFVRLPIKENIKWLEQQITELNIEIGHYTEIQSHAPDPEYPDYIQEGREVIEHLVAELKRLEFRLSKHDHFIMSCWTWFGEIDTPMDQRMKKAADYRVDLRLGRVDPFLQHLHDHEDELDV